MSGPPSDISPADLWAAIQARPRPSDVVEAPFDVGGRRPRVRIIVLPELDEREILIDARRSVLAQLSPDERKNIGPTDLSVDPALSSLYADAAAREILSRAVVGVEPASGAGTPRPTYARIFPDADSMGRELSDDAIRTLWHQYQLVKSKFSPVRAIMSDAEERAWIKVLAEGGSANPLADLHMSEWQTLTTSLAQKVYAAFSCLAGLLTESPQLSGTIPAILVEDITSATWLPVSQRGSSLVIDLPEGYAPDTPDDVRDWPASPEMARKIENH